MNDAAQVARSSNSSGADQRIKRLLAALREGLPQVVQAMRL
ncbi:MAG: hypothetical protein ACYDDS_18450 [Candidatus Sulfotelmatobacter sp.]